MKILWINHRDLKHPEAGGSEVHIAEVGKRLVEKGHEVTLLTESFKDSKSEAKLSGMRIKRFGGKFTLHIYAPYFVKRNSEKFDIIIDDIAHAVPFWSSKFTKKPVVAIVHHIHQDVIERELHFPLSYFVKKAERSISGTYKNLIAVSQTTKKELVQQLGVDESRIKIIYHGINHNKYFRGMKFDKPTILWLGRMKKYKNIDHVIKAFYLVKKAVKDAKLILAGRGEEEYRIKTLVSKMMLNNVIFTGRVSEDDKVKLLQRSWCIVYTSEVEGWGMGVLEAASCGTPAVTYNSGALSETIIDGKTGFLVRYGDIHELAKKLIELLEHDTLRKNLSENALKYSYNFDWDKTAEQTEEYLKTLL